jgi:hypothetical protein
MNDNAFYGLAGDVVERIDSTTEASREAMLVQFLIAAGNRLGRAVVLKHSGQHYGNDYCVLVGDTNSGRKGTSLNNVFNVFESFTPAWMDRVRTGLQSGEAVIHCTRDEIRTFNKNGQPVVIPGEADKRILIVEEEFSRILTICARKDSTLTWVLNELWDSRVRLATTSKTNPEKSTGVHGSLIGHVTPSVLQQKIAKSEIEGGFANRFLWVAVQGKPEPVYDAPWIDWSDQTHSDISACFDLLGEFCQPFENPAQGVKPVANVITWSPEAKKLWQEFYREQRKPARTGGMLEYILQRASAHVLRLTLIYTALDRSLVIQAVHIRAALAVWDYCRRSAIWIFGYRTESTDAEKIRWELERSEDGIMRSRISSVVFSGHASATRIDQALSALVAAGLARMEMRSDGDKLTPYWFSTEPPG